MVSWGRADDAGGFCWVVDVKLRPFTMRSGETLGCVVLSPLLLVTKASELDEFYSNSRIRSRTRRRADNQP